MSRNWKIAFLAALSLGLIVCAYFLRTVFLPLLVALLLAYVLNPIVTSLEKRNVPRMASIAGVYVMLLGIVAALAFWAVPAAFAEAADFLEDLFVGEKAKIHKLTAKVEPHLKKWMGAESWQESVTILRRKALGGDGDLNRVGGKVFGEVVSFMGGGLASLFSVFSFLALVPVYLFFLLKNLNSWWERFTHWIPRGYRDRSLATLGRIHRSTMAFFRGQVTISLIEGGIVFLGLSLIGVRYPLLFGLLYAALSVIPFLGVTVMFTVVELFVLADTGRFGSTFFLSAGLFALIQVIEGLALQPMILGKETGLHPIVLILALLVTGQTLGIFGMLLAIPLASTLNILLQDYIRPMFEEVADVTRVMRKSD